jgi:hypothetical protein
MDESTGLPAELVMMGIGSVQLSPSLDEDSQRLEKEWFAGPWVTDIRYVEPLTTTFGSPQLYAPGTTDKRTPGSAANDNPSLELALAIP